MTTSLLHPAVPTTAPPAVFHVRADPTESDSISTEDPLDPLEDVPGPDYADNDPAAVRAALLAALNAARAAGLSVATVNALAHLVLNEFFHVSATQWVATRRPRCPQCARSSTSPSHLPSRVHAVVGPRHGLRSHARRRPYRACLPRPFRIPCVRRAQVGCHTAHACRARLPHSGRLLSHQRPDDPHCGPPPPP
jgi:hypothetical protein